MDTALSDLTNLALLGFGAFIGAGLLYAYHLRCLSDWERQSQEDALKAHQDLQAEQRMGEHWKEEAKRLQASLDGADTYTPALRWPRPLGLQDRRPM